MTDRRAFLAAALVAPVAIAAPAVASSSPISAYWSAHHGLNGGTVEEAEYLAALDSVIAWKPQTPEQFMQKFLVLCDDRDLTGDKIMIGLWRDARRLAA